MISQELWVLCAFGATGSAVIAVRFAKLGYGWREQTASALLLLVWKLWRLPGRRALSPYVLWGSGWMVMVGLWWLALLPASTLGALHVVFIGGFALLTVGIGTRVVVAHGRHPMADEPRTLTPLVVATVAVALLARLGAEWAPAKALPMLGASGAVWVLGWLLWALRAVPRMARVRPAPAPPA